MLSLLQIVYAITSVVWFVIIVHIIMSWLINFQVLNLQQPFVQQVWYGLQRLVEPIYGPIRRMLPNMGGLDLSPVIVLLILFAIRTVIQNNMYQFY